MSAFVVTDDHITAICTFACRYGVRADLWRDGTPRPIVPADHAELFRMLKQANIDSVCARYDEPREIAEPRCGRLELSPVAVIVAIDCLAYQSSEVDGWPDTDACKTLESLRRWATYSLPGYDKAAWCIPAGAATYPREAATA